MGEMAQDALDYAFVTEELLDDYVSGDMPLQEAFEHGFLDPLGRETEGVQNGWDRAVIGTPEQLNNQLSHALKDLTIATTPKKQKPKLFPVCNCCNKEMTPRNGKYGKFYFCQNRCKNQKCVSETYWKTVKT